MKFSSLFGSINISSFHDRASSRGKLEGRVRIDREENREENYYRVGIEPTSIPLSLQSFPEFLFSLARREKGERSDEVCEDRAIADSMGGEFNERTRVNSPRDANGWKIKLEERKKNARRRQSRGNEHGWWEFKRTASRIQTTARTPFNIPSDMAVERQSLAWLQIAVLMQNSLLFTERRCLIWSIYSHGKRFVDGCPSIAGSNLHAPFIPTLGSFLNAMREFDDRKGTRVGRDSRTICWTNDSISIPWSRDNVSHHCRIDYLRAVIETGKKCPATWRTRLSSAFIQLASSQWKSSCTVVIILTSHAIYPSDIQVGNLKSFAEFRPISKSNGVEERRKVRGTIFGERINYLSCTRKRSNHGKLCKFFSKQLNSGQSVEMLLTHILNIAKRQLKASSKRPFRSAIAEKS